MTRKEHGVKTKDVRETKGGIGRRKFLGRGAALGAAADALALNPTLALSAEPPSALDRVPDRAGESGFQPLEVDSPMARWKRPQSLEFVTGATERFSFPNWQSGNDDSVYYNLNIPSFFKSRVVMPPDEFSVLGRAIQPDLLDQTLTAYDGRTTPPLKEYLVGPRQVQAMMAHKGRVVFETYPGMNPDDIHVWMSASKTTAGLMLSMPADEGKVDPEKPVSAYVPELKGSARDNITVKNTMNMSVAVDNEETFESLTDPESWITSFFTSVFGVGSGDSSQWRKLLKNVKPLPNEKPGDRFRYSTSNTQVLVLITEQVTQMPWQAFWNERVWSKIGARNPFIIGLTPDGSPIAGGLNNTTPEDMLRYALLYTPSWHVVASEQVVSDRLLKLIQTMGDPAAYKVSTEFEYGTKWFGETPLMNTAQWDHAFADGAMFKHGNIGQGIYIGPARDFVGVYYSCNGYVPPCGEDKMPGCHRWAAKYLAGGVKQQRRGWSIRAPAPQWQRPTKIQSQR